MSDMGVVGIRKSLVLDVSNGMTTNHCHNGVGV